MGQDEWVKLNLRLPPELKAALEARTVKSKRSLNAEIVWLLEQIIKAQEKIAGDGVSFPV